MQAPQEEEDKERAFSNLKKEERKRGREEEHAVNGKEKWRRVKKS